MQERSAWQLSPASGQVWAQRLCGSSPAKTAALACSPGHLNSSASSLPKFAVRGLAQSLAVELWPKGIHVAHVIVDGVIDTPQMRKRHALPAQEPLLKPEAIAEAYWNLIQQGRSAWSLEIDLRPNNEAFFE